ncbi:terpene synthase family protein [Kitasatospora sp. NPDC059646]|uniref:terpene synthase family protein n=1 Tax=Kitasatospora sp. NPDC059646 TaxID=3346893 RepID=UPI00369839CF
MSPAATGPATAQLRSTGQLPSGGPLSELLARTPAPPPHPHADALRAELTHWLAGTGVLDAAGTARFLDRGHLELAARCWGDVPAGPGLRTAAKWLLLAGILDDHVEDRRPGDPTGAARHTIGALHALFAGGTPTAAPGHGAALVRAFAALRRDGAALTGPDWAVRCDADFRAHLDSSLARLSADGTVPTVPQYLTHRERDGAARCAAGWVELAHGLDLPDRLHRHPQLTDLLTRFRHLVRWIDDLGAGRTAASSGRTLVRALEVHRGLPPRTAAARVAELCAAELTTLEFLADGIARGSHWPTPVRRHARGLVRYAHALIHWTADR